MVPSDKMGQVTEPGQPDWAGQQDPAGQPVAPADWEPAFVDYLYFSFTNATAFSPTDVMPLAR